MSNILTPTMCKTARTFLEWSQADLSKAAGVSLSTVARFELAQGVATLPIRDKLYSAFVEGGVQFIASDNAETAELDGIGLRKRPDIPNNRIKVV